MILADQRRMRSDRIPTGGRPDGKGKGIHMYEMKEEYKTGIEMIDEEHKRLFEIAEETYQLLHNNFVPDKYDHVVALLEELREYTRKHFADEEAYMESIRYKRIFTQKIQHQSFIEKLDAINLDEVDENPEQMITDLLEFLTNWLIHHILEVDKLIGN